MPLTCIICTFFFCMWKDEVLNGPRATVFYTTGDQGEEKEFSKEEVEEMMKSDAYQRKIDTCHL